MYIFEDIVYFPGVCLVQLHSSELSSSSSQHPENREIAQRCARTVYIFEEDCVCFECQTILPNCHPHHQLYSRQFSPIVIPTISYIQGCSSTQTFPRLFLTEKKKSIYLPKYSYSCIDVQNIIIKYRFFGLVDLQQKSWNGLQSIAIFLWHHLFTWARPSIIAIEHYLLAAFRPHVTFAT